MTSALLRSSTLRGWAVRRVLAAAAAAAPSGGEGLAARRTVPLRRFVHSGDQPPKSLDDKVNSLRQSINELNKKLDSRYLIHTSIHKLIEERKLPNPFIQWSWQVALVALIVLVEHSTSSTRNDN